MGLRETIERAADRPVVKEPVPEWGCDVYLRVWGGREQDEYEAMVLSRRGPDDAIVDPRGLRAWVLVRTLCDADGRRIFTDDEAEVLNEKNARVISRLAERAMAVNGLTDGLVEELEGNSDGGRSGASGSA